MAEDRQNNPARSPQAPPDTLLLLDLQRWATTLLRIRQETARFIAQGHRLLTEDLRAAYKRLLAARRLTQTEVDELTNFARLLESLVPPPAEAPPAADPPADPPAEAPPAADPPRKIKKP